MTSGSPSPAAPDRRRHRQRHGRPALLREAGRVRRRAGGSASSRSAKSRGRPTTASGLTSFFAHRDAEKLMLARREWYREQGIELHLGDRAIEIDRERQDRRLGQGRGDRLRRCRAGDGFVSRSCRRCRASTSRACSSIARSKTWSGSSPTPSTSRRCAVIGGGLLGLEAAKAAYDLGLETHVVEFAPRLMPRQVDDAGSRTARRQDRGARRAACT